MGLVGLAKTIALEGAKDNIHCNIIVPTAASRMTKDIMPDVIFNELSKIATFQITYCFNYVYFRT